MKTPEEIKNGLECCISDTYGCYEKCPYFKSLSNGVDCAVKMHADALAYINQLEARIPKWISVEDRLPEIGTVVLGYAKHNPFSAYEVMLVRNLENGFEMIRYQKYAARITHWMPLPEPPKDDMHE